MMIQYLITFFLIASGGSDYRSHVDLHEEVQFVSFEKLKTIIEERSVDKTLVVNFWATWCVPCVKELPVFEELQTEGEYEFLYVSLDFERKIDSKLVPFVKEHSFLENRVVVLDQSNSNEWIPQVDDSWSGAIPATLVISKSGEIFHEGSFSTVEDLKSFINKKTH